MHFLTWRAPMAALWKRRSVLKSWAISLTRRWKGSFLMSSSVDFWYRRISRRATVPGLWSKPYSELVPRNKNTVTTTQFQKTRVKLVSTASVTGYAYTNNTGAWLLYLYLWGFFTPPVEGALFLAALVASCFLGAFPPVDLRAVCFVRAISHL